MFLGEVLYLSVLIVVKHAYANIEILFESSPITRPDGLNVNL